MSLTLGEKLRQAREERGFTLSEVAEQTRISSLYLESIENDDYRILPGGIFNKGFVKSYAKHVGINEQEALSDYSRLLAESEGPGGDELKTYRPEVLTDDRSSGSMVPTVIMAVIILGLMTAGILFLLNYLRQPTEEPAVNTAVKTSINSSSDVPGPVNSGSPGTIPDMATLKVEFAALDQPVSLTATSDGKTSSSVVAAMSNVTFEPKESLKLGYSRSLAQFVRLTINGKEIRLPSSPLNPKRNVIEVEINKDNLARIWAAGSIVTDIAATPDANSNTVATTSTPAVAAATPAQTRPISTPAVTANKSIANTAASPERPRTVKPSPALRPTVIPVPPANR